MGSGNLNWPDVIQALLRWAHIIAGITWIGHLYFFNWVNGPFTGTLDKETKPKVVPELMPRALFWFRWGAAWTWITGFLLIALVFYHSTNEMFGAGPEAKWSAGAGAMVALTFLSPLLYSPIASSGLAKNGSTMFWVGLALSAALFYAFVHVGGFGYRAAVIHLGATYGTLMAFNVWFKIWPAQQKIIPAVKAGQAPDAALAGMAGLRSKHNTYMSIPLVWAMINQHTAGSFASLIYPGVSMVLSIAIGWWFCSLMYKKGAAVKGF